MSTRKSCPHCGHKQKLFEPTLKKLQSYGHRIIRCSKCGSRIRLSRREIIVKKNN